MGPGARIQTNHIACYWKNISRMPVDDTILYQRIEIQREYEYYDWFKGSPSDSDNQLI